MGAQNPTLAPHAPKSTAEASHAVVIKKPQDNKDISKAVILHPPAVTA